MANKRRFLLVTLDAAGNWPPERELIRALVKRGHDVRVISDADHAQQIAEVGAHYRRYRIATEKAIRRRDPAEDERTFVLRNVLLNTAFGDELLAEVANDAPDILLVDTMLRTALVAAESTGLPTANLIHSVYAAFFGMTLPVDPMRDPLNAVRGKLGLPAVSSSAEISRRCQAMLAFTHQAFDAPLENPPQQLHYVGPLACLPQPEAPYEMPWPRNDLRPLILVSFSTSFQDQIDTLQRVADAVATLPARVLLTLGGAVPANALRLPNNVVAVEFAPHAAVLPHASLVITHAGHGTVMAATTAGVPMVCMPMGRDQFAVSACVERCRIGVITSMTTPVDELKRTIAAALADTALHERSRTFAATLDVEAGLNHAIEVLENLPVAAA